MMFQKFPLRRLVVALVLTAALASIFGCRPRASKPPHQFAIQKTSFRVGDTEIWTHTTSSGNNNTLTIVHLHEDERTAVEAARVVLEKHGGRLIQLVHSGQRRVSFSLDGAWYSFDPNRIFSQEGVGKTVRGETPIPDKAYTAVKEFGEQFIRYFGFDQLRPLIAIHNNGEGFLSINSYASNAENKSDAAQLFVTPTADPDDFYYVTDETYFNTLRENGFNVVLQDNKTSRDDGSLSIFAGRRNIPYINVEAQNDHRDEQIRMLELAVKITTAGRSSGFTRREQTARSGK